MFKLGLLLEATSDFEQLHAMYGKKEPGASFNLAICQFQNGMY